jgi:hypothetical protein
MNRQYVCNPGKGFACTVRVTAMKDCKAVIDPATGLPLQVTSTCIAGINTSPFRVTTEDLVPPQACPGDPCWRIRGCTREQYMQFDRLEFQGFDSNLIDIMTKDAAGIILGDIAIGYDRTTARSCDVDYALEVFSKVGLGTNYCNNSDNELAWYELYANMQNTVVGGQTRDQTTPNTLVFENARNMPNPSWGLGPYGVQPGGLALPKTAIERQMLWVDAAGAVLPIPVANCVDSALYVPVQ